MLIFDTLIRKHMSSESGLSDSATKVEKAKLQEFMGKIVNDLGATWSTVLVIIGDKRIYQIWFEYRKIYSTSRTSNGSS